MEKMHVNLMADMDEIKAAVQEEDCTSLANWSKDLSLISRHSLENVFKKTPFFKYNTDKLKEE